MTIQQLSLNSKPRYRNLFIFLYSRCPDAYVGDYCEHNNPCHGDVTRCHNGASCQVTIRPSDGYIGSKCVCALGFHGSACEQEDENSACAADPCLNSGSCRLVGSIDDYVCDCVTGFTGEWNEGCARYKILALLFWIQVNEDLFSLARKF